MVAHILLKQNALPEEDYYADIIHSFPKERYKRGGLFVEYNTCK